VFGRLVPLDGQTMPAIPAAKPQNGVNPRNPTATPRPTSNGGGSADSDDDTQSGGAEETETPSGDSIISDALRNAFDRIKNRGGS
jgi:hypothetical protein